MNENIILSNIDELFSKEIEDFESGNCKNGREVYPCSHERMKVIYKDGTFKYFRVGAIEIERICKINNKNLPPHFDYMKKYKNN